MPFTHCQQRDFGTKKCSVLSKILIGFSENPLELGEIGGDFRARIFTVFSVQMGVESLESTAFSRFSYLPLSSVKFRQVRFLTRDSKSVCAKAHMGSNPFLSANAGHRKVSFLFLPTGYERVDSDADGASKFQRKNAEIKTHALNYSTQPLVRSAHCALSPCVSIIAGKSL